MTSNSAGLFFKIRLKFILSPDGVGACAIAPLESYEFMMISLNISHRLWAGGWHGLQSRPEIVRYQQFF
ncbi:MAG: hypothetical protein HC772_18265 [Leptolyngbyaceae cyanobacterium CRU_2_3]|nr:hypothetical protein [Leptolyngbyaceae cyanobacterium CRU_2_3]